MFCTTIKESIKQIFLERRDVLSVSVAACYMVDYLEKLHRHATEGESRNPGGQNFVLP